MTDVRYTDHLSTNSTLVDDVFYNENDATLTVDLNDEIYRYSGVPKDVFEGFRTADSAGRYYTKHVKGAGYGSAEHVGNYDEVEFERVFPTRTKETVGTPKGLTYAADAKVTNVASIYTLDQPTSVSTASTSTAPAKVFDLSSKVAPSSRRHAVTFEVNGAVKTHTLQSESVDEAVYAVEEIGDMLDLDFVVKSVTVYFE